MPQKMLPLGLQSFQKIIENGYHYVDKTEYIFRLCARPGAYFFSRPRRFGKSLTLSTLEALYSGKKQLFEGLWIEDKWDWNRCYPIVRISFTAIGFSELGLSVALEQELRLIAASHNITLQTLGITSQLRELIIAIAKKEKVVVLIDEYDLPIIQYLTEDIEKAYQNRSILKDFYSVLKDLDDAIEMVFITGVSRFSKIGIFSGLNNLTDLSMNPDFSSMLGYTQQELESTFQVELKQTASHLKLSMQEVLEKMKVWYNGYCFSPGTDKVYNPVSCNQFFFEKSFKNYWFATGTPGFLVTLLKKEGIFDLHFPPVNPSGFDSFDLDRLKPIAILFQTGYLTIREEKEYGLIQLDYPNKEVQNSMLEILIETYTGLETEFSASLILRLRSAFEKDDLPVVFQLLREVFSSLPYFVLEQYPEKFFHAAIHLLFTYLGIRIQSEVCTSNGRIDSLVETTHTIYILEYKLDVSAEKALQQIRDKKYYLPYWSKGKPIVGVGVQFSSQTKNIEQWQAETLLSWKTNG